MKELLGTRSSGLVGAEAVAGFASAGWQVCGVDNKLRADCFGP